MKYVIQTNVLSKTCLWTSLPYLRFEICPIRGVAMWVEFVNQVLLLRESSRIQTLSIVFPKIHRFSDTPQVESWFRVAMQRKLKNLHLKFHHDSYNPVPRFGFSQIYIQSLPPYLFNCKSLTSLNLEVDVSGCYCYKAIVLAQPSTINLPLLTSLSLGAIDIVSTSSCQAVHFWKD
ncbi:hypothetical protein AQUCO_04400125v1 [Aquilegia coerulea]|uniref:FBD domain-containing protein n=1 Tax=Aquilegia coerulea TaxID=218851 RepID=A0A2G5CN41_AQUCA|nr:hypothetical protein AQUCO_04400125v1 [Aquilegia coerulea]